MSTLFLKYRPQNFDDLVGQAATIKTLKNAIKNGNPAHAYLFTGSRGTGKTSSARIFAKALLAGDKNGNPDEKNPLIQQINDGSLVDVIEIDAASNRKIEEMRDLREKIKFAPVQASKKVYIIDEVHMLTKESFNALLKTLEEPPDFAYFVLATTELHKVPETIISRCQVFRFSRFSVSQIVGRLEFICEKEGIKAEKEALEVIAERSEGGLRDAIGYLERLAAESSGKITTNQARKSLGGVDTAFIVELFANIAQNKGKEALQMLKNMENEGADPRSLAGAILGYLRSAMTSKPEAGKAYLQAISAFLDATKQLSYAPIPYLPLEVAIVSLLEGETGDMPLTQVKSDTKKVKEEEKVEKISETKKFAKEVVENPKNTPEVKNDEATIRDFAFENEMEAKPTKKVSTSAMKPKKSNGKVTQAKAMSDFMEIIKDKKYNAMARAIMKKSELLLEGEKVYVTAGGELNASIIEKSGVLSVLADHFSAYFDQKPSVSIKIVSKKDEGADISDFVL